MELRIKGQEGKLTLTCNGKELVMRVEDFSLDPMHEITESDFIGELTSAFDYQFNGHGVSWTTHEEDGKIMAFLVAAQDRELSSRAPLPCTVAFTRTFRKPGEPNQTVFLSEAVVIAKDYKSSGRKDYTKFSFEGKAKKLKLI